MTTPRSVLSRASVVIPAYNASTFLPDAIRSALTQTWHEVEVIVVDDGSTDDTGSIAEGFANADSRLRVTHKPNGGLSSARNAGMAIATGDAICFLDADDILLPDKLERQMGYLNQFPDCDLVYSDYYVGDGNLSPLWLASVRRDVPRMEDYLLYRNGFAPMCPLLRSGLVARTGLFDEVLRAAEDWDYWIRAAQHGRFCYLPGPVGVYRTHPDQMSRNRTLMRTSDLRVAQKNFRSGSQEWRIMMASRAWAEGREAWWDRKLWLAPAKFLRSAWIARSPRILRDVMRWA
jgi:glycosyltransferase involved in cell wall biosynthesis